MGNVRPEDGGRGPDRSSLKARDDVVVRQVDDEWVLYDPVSEKMHVLNATASLVWNSLDGTSTIEELVESMLEVFEPPVSTEVLTRDVQAVLAQLSSEDLLT